jgi:hypothetical protein
LFHAIDGLVSDNALLVAPCELDGHPDHDAVGEVCREVAKARAEDKTGAERTRGLKVRHLIERACTEVLDRFARATGPHLLAYDAQIVRQHQALALYIRQCHGERDLAEIPAWPQPT